MVWRKCCDVREIEKTAYWTLLSESWLQRFGDGQCIMFPAGSVVVCWDGTYEYDCMSPEEFNERFVDYAVASGKARIVMDAMPEYEDLVRESWAQRELKAQ